MPGASQFTRKSMDDIMEGVNPGDFTPQQMYILQSFQSQVYIQNKMDVQDEPIFDTIIFVTDDEINSNTSSWFTNVGSRSGKTLADTNMKREGTLIAPEAQAIFQYRLKFNEDIDLRDFLAITKGFSFVFTMGTKDYQTGPIFTYAAGGGIYGNFTTTSTQLLHNGLPSDISCKALSVNLVIENEESFSANLQGIPSYTVLGEQVRIQCLLMGLHARPIR